MLSKNLIPTNKNPFKLYPFNHRKTPIQEIYEQYENELEKEFKSDLPYYIEKEDIPEDPQEFYQDFGYLEHPRTMQPITELTPYQYKIWNSKAKTVIVVKPQKTGVTTSVLLQDFQTAITKGKGRDILIIAQTMGHAIEHINTLKRLILNSPKYRKYLITTSKEMYFREEKTKLGAVYIKNPDNPFRPSRIIAVPFSVHGVWSWKNVYRIHMSDVAATETIDDKQVYDAAGTRFASTEGFWLIESPPNGTHNYYFELYEKYKYNTDPTVQVITVDIEEAINHKVVSREFIESEKNRLGHMWYKFYGSSFLETEGNFFSIASIDKAIEKGKLYPVEEFRPTSEKYMAADIGFESSKFAILVGEWDRNNRHLRILHSEEMQSPLFEEAIDRILELRKQFGNVLRIAIDATSRQEFCTALKIKLNDWPYHWAQVKERINECNIRNIPIEKRMTVIPIIFNTESKLKMAAHTQQLLDDSRNLVSISPRFDKLITSMKGAVFDDRGMLDKRSSPSNDTLDAFMMLAQFIKFRN
jgi:hypothetical protein